MDLQFEIDPAEFQDRKRRRISEMNNKAPPPPKLAPTSAPAVHDITGFLPGRLEFEHEIENDAEDLVKDIEFGVCLDYGGDQIVEDEDDLDVRARVKWEEERRAGVTVSRARGKSLPAGKGTMATKGLMNGTAVNGHHPSSSVGDIVKRENLLKTEDVTMANGNASADEGDVEEVTQPPPIETKNSLTFKLTLMEMYSQRVEKRLEGKGIIFERGLLEYKKVRPAPVSSVQVLRCFPS